MNKACCKSNISNLNRIVFSPKNPFIFMHCMGYNLLSLIQRFRQTIQSVYEMDKGIINCRFLDTVLRDINSVVLQ